MNLPSSWLRMSYRNRCFYLVDTHQAKNYYEATKMIGKRGPRGKVPRETVEAFTARMEAQKLF